MAEHDDRLWQLLRAHRGMLFSHPEDLKDIALERMIVPKHFEDEPRMMIEEELQFLTFGQLLAYYAEMNRMDIATVADHCQIGPDTVVGLYDDTILPWDCEPSEIVHFTTVLGIPLDVAIDTIENQPLEDDILMDRLPPNAMVARTVKNLDPATRAKELRDSNLAIQQSREDRKRKKFILTLRRTTRE